MSSARSHAAPWLRAATFAPALRGDLTFVPHGHQFVRVYEPASQQFVQLYLLECHIAQLMNGRRGLDDLTAIARQFNPGNTRVMIERIVLNLSSVGLLDRTTAPWQVDADSRDALEWHSAAAPVPPRAPLLLDAQRTFEPQRPMSSSSFVPLRVVPDEEEVDLNADTLLARPDDTALAPASEIPAAPPPPPVETPPEEVEPDAAPAEESEESEEPPAEAEAEAEPETPADIAEQEQEALWNEKKKRWYQRTSVRVLAVLVLLAGIAAVIPYPLRITSECEIIPDQRVKVRSEIEGVIAEILVDEGQTVKKGDVIARIDDRALKADRQKVLAEIEKIDAEAATLRQGRRPEEIQQQEAVVAARRNEVAFAAKEANRRMKMAREGVGSRQSADTSRGELESRRKALAEAEAALRLIKAGSRPEEISAKEATLKSARAQLAFIDERLAMTVVKAPIDGEILTPRFRERIHESVEAGGLVCEIANTRRMRAEIFVPEREIDTVTIGMPTVVKVESYPTHPFKGKVNFIAPSVDGKDKRVRVVVEIENQEGLLKANMSGYGEIEVGDRSLLHLATRRLIRWIRVRFLL